MALRIPKLLPSSGMLSLTREYAEEDFDEYTSPYPVKSNSLSKCTVFPANELFFNIFMWTQVMVLHDGLDGHYLHACRAQNHGQRKHNPCRVCTLTRFPTIITSVASCNPIRKSTNESLRTSACLSSDLISCSSLGVLPSERLSARLQDQSAVDHQS